MDELLDHAPCGYISFTDTGALLDVNSTLLEILEYAPGDLQDRKFESILTVSSRIFFQTHFFPLLRLHGSANEIFFSLRSKSAKTIPVLVNAVRREQVGSYVNVCVLMVVAQRQVYEGEILQAKSVAEAALRNNEQLSKAKQELEQHTQELDQRISQLEQKNREHQRVSQILFHDLWEPLRKILTFADLLEHGQPVPEEWSPSTPAQTSLLDRIRASAMRMVALLRSLQEFAAVDRLDEVVASVNLNVVIAQAKWAATREGNECEIVSTILPVIEGYPQQLGLLFSQLIDNSIKFCAPDVTPVIRITHSLIQENRYRMNKDRYRYVEFIKIVFEDNSVGFDNQYRNSIFGLLTKLEPNSPGSGVGLAICQKIVENHFGSISVQSEVGKGVSFTILLPLQQQVFNPTSAQMAS